jgi:hypothetical protein
LIGDEMKIEKRGKSPGVKVHLDPEECEAFIELVKDTEMSQAHGQHLVIKDTYFTVALKIGKKLKKIAEDEPDFLSERTPEQIKASMLKDLEKINAQLKAGIDDGSWKHVE